VTTRKPAWPPDVQPISVADLARLGIDKNRQRSRDSQKIEIRRLDLTTAAAILGGLGGFRSGLADPDTLFCTHSNHHTLCRLLHAD